MAQVFWQAPGIAKTTPPAQPAQTPSIYGWFVSKVDAVKGVGGIKEALQSTTNPTLIFPPPIPVDITPPVIT